VTRVDLRPWRAPEVANVEELRAIARRRLPRMIFDYVDGAAGDECGDEWTMNANRRAFEELCFRPRPMVDVSTIDQRVSVFGHKIEMPVMLGPAGPALVHHRGELAVAKAAATAGTIFVMGAGASYTVEEVAEAGRGGALWMQVYLWRDRNVVRSLVDQAHANHFQALCLTVDSLTGAYRDRDIRNGLTIPPHVTFRNAFNVARHPRWLWHFTFHQPIFLKNLESLRSKDALTVLEVMKHLKNQSATWDELSWLRGIWDGPIVVKGILTPEAANEAFDRGADGVVCSNHGGRELNGALPSLAALPRIVDAARRRNKEVFLDGGVRRGGDVVKALSLGARACLVARPYHWALAAGGEAGVVKMCEMLRTEIASVLGMLGRPTLSDLDPSGLAKLEPGGYVALEADDDS
jgi:L-lactate dehydrogenase (cytochrome)